VIIGASIVEHRTLPTLRPFREVFLLSYRIRLGQPAAKFGVDVVQGPDAKSVEVIARRKRLHAAKTWTLESSREHDVAIQPCSARRYLRKRHTNMERDARLLGQHVDRADVANRRDDRVEQRANLRRLSREMMLEIVAATGVRLVAIRELPTASLAPPQRRPIQSCLGEWSMLDDTSAVAAAPRAPGMRVLCSGVVRRSISAPPWWEPRCRSP
jgi:hypothetical protein